MKKKLVSIISLALALTMTTSAFAAIGPRPRGTGDVDGDGKLTGNDVVRILRDLATDNPEANIDGVGVVDGKDANVAYKTILQPKTVTEDLRLNIYSGSKKINVNFLDSVKLGSGEAAVSEDKGMKKVDIKADVKGTYTIEQAADEAAELSKNQLPLITENLNKICFTSAVKGEVSLRSENGWAMLCYALRYIVPFDDASAALCNKKDSVTFDGKTNMDRYNALMEVKKILVGNGPIEGTLTPEQAAQQKTDELTAADIDTIKEQLKIAFPSTLTRDEIEKTAVEVLKITDSKYEFAVTYNGETTVLKSDTIVGSKFLEDVISLADYKTKTVADCRNTFGDKVVGSATNLKTGKTINGVVEVAVIAE